MNDLFTPIYLDIKDKKRNLTVKAAGIVKSTKYFPVFEFNQEEYIFKPLSKTKPVTTPLFAYSEVYWSYLTNKFFDINAPIYQLAYCKGLSQEQEKYYEYGTLVKSTIKENQKLVNLLEYFNQNPDPTVNISIYVNYCLVSYNYSAILNSKFLTKNYELGKKVAWQVLQSILRKDQNFHYENVSFIYQDEQLIDLNPPLDYEFSNMFLFPDNKKLKQQYNRDWLNGCHLLNNDEHAKRTLAVMVTGDKTLLRPRNILNICTIVKLYPDLVQNFIATLEPFRQEVAQLEIKDDYNYIIPCNSDTWNIGNLRYKEHLEKEATELEKQILPTKINKEEIFKRIKDETIKNSYNLENLLKIYLYAYYNNIEQLEYLTLENVLDFINNQKENDENQTLKRILEKSNQI